MSTTFYFKVKIKMDLSMEVDYRLKKDILEKTKVFLDDVSLIRIGKRSGGWMPLFYSSPYYSSIKELKKFYTDNKECIDIVDEYGIVYSLKELENELFSWNKNSNKAKSHSNIDSRFYIDEEGYEFSKNNM